MLDLVELEVDPDDDDSFSSEPVIESPEANRDFGVITPITRGRIQVAYL